MTVKVDHDVDVLAAEPRSDELAQIMRAYNQVTQNLQRSHDSLRDQVVRLQGELASTDAQLQRSKRLAALGEMAAGIAHEIRNPLAAIQLYAQMIGDDLKLPDRGQAADHSGKIVEAVRGLNAIVVDVLHFSREVKPCIAAVAVEPLVQRAIDAQRPMIQSANVTVRCDIDDALLIAGDARLLHQALLNLMRNAIEAIGSNPEGGTLTIGAQRCDEQIRLTVRDTGSGIVGADIDRIFNPFFTTRNTGTGLGLAIVHRIVDAHGGTICVHNDGGAVFEMMLPAAAALVGVE